MADRPPAHMIDVSDAGFAVCRLEELPDPGTAGFILDVKPDPLRVMVIRENAAVHAYVNKCPHSNVPLDDGTGQFLSPISHVIMCSVHGAMFAIETGLGIGGHGLGTSLISVPARVENGTVFLNPQTRTR